MKVTVIKKLPEVGGVMSFWLQPEEQVTWQAGQYGHYILPELSAEVEEGNDRYFTVSSAPFEEHLAITTRIRQSAFKQALGAMNEGDSFELEDGSVEGDFVVTDWSQSYVFIAGGIGITPFRSMLAQADHDDQSIKATLLYGNRSLPAVFQSELESIASRQPDFKMQLVVDPEQIDEAIIRKAVPDLHAPHFYLSGPKPMVKPVIELLKSMGVAQDNITKDFFPGYDTI